MTNVGCLEANIILPTVTHNVKQYVFSKLQALTYLITDHIPKSREAAA